MSLSGWRRHWAAPAALFCGLAVAGALAGVEAHADPTAAGFERDAPQLRVPQVAFTEIRSTRKRTHALDIKLALGQLCGALATECVPGFRGDVRNVGLSLLLTGSPLLPTHGHGDSFGFAVDLRPDSPLRGPGLENGATFSFMVPLTWLFLPSEVPGPCVTRNAIEFVESLDGVSLSNGLSVNFVVTHPGGSARTTPLILDPLEYVCPGS